MRLRWVALLVLIVALFPAAVVEVCQKVALTVTGLVEHFISAAG